MKRRSGLLLLVCSAGTLLLLSGCPPAALQAGDTRIFDGIRFQYCPPGTFTMGSPVGEEDRVVSETQHQVKLTKGFWLSKYEITQQQYQNVMGNNPSTFQGIGRPVDSVSWDEAQAFVTQLNATTSGSTYRLPTESEWEYACRAGTTTRYYWGEDSNETAILLHAWFADNSNRRTHAVGRKLANDWGLNDMAGNVMEWCQDYFGNYPTGPITDPTGPTTGTSRIMRGGGHGHLSPGCRAAFRVGYLPSAGDRDMGFRLLREAD